MDDKCEGCGADMTIERTHWEGCHTSHKQCAAFKAGREAGMREASEICKKRADWILTQQDGKPEELSNVILRHHASAHVSAQEEILSAIDK